MESAEEKTTHRLVELLLPPEINSFPLIALSEMIYCSYCQ